MCLPVQSGLRENLERYDNLIITCLYAALPPEAQIKVGFK